MIKLFLFLLTLSQVFGQSSIYIESKKYYYFANSLSSDYILSTISLSSLNNFDVYQMTTTQFNEFSVFYPVGAPFQFLKENSVKGVQVFSRTDVEATFPFYWVILNNSTSRIQVFYSHNSRNLKRTSNILFI